MRHLHCAANHHHHRHLPHIVRANMRGNQRPKTESKTMKQQITASEI